MKGGYGERWEMVGFDSEEVDWFVDMEVNGLVEGADGLDGYDGWSWNVLEEEG